MKKILIATTNPAKEKMWKFLLKDSNLEVLTLKNLNLENEKVVEDGKTAEQNALIKARHFYNFSKIPTIGDDAGLHIDALNGEPGVKARRWNDELPEDINDEAWLSHLLNKLKNVPDEKRTGQFKAYWALITEDGKYTKEITIPFLIKKDPIRPYPKGWPLAAVQFDLTYKKMFKDLTEKEKFSCLMKHFKKWDIEEKIK